VSEQTPQGHTGRYPPGLSGYTHGNCRCTGPGSCTEANTAKRREQRAGLVGKPRRSFEDRVREEMSA